MMKSTRKMRAERLEDRTLLAADLDLLQSTVDQPSDDGVDVASVADTTSALRDDPQADGGQRSGGDRHSPPPPSSIESQYTVDGTGNNVENPDWGSTGEQLQRLTTVEYADGISEAAGDDRPSARDVSNEIVAQTESIVNDRNLTDFVWLWGQFIDHDIDLTENADPAEPLPIEVPTGDVYFDPDSDGDVTIDFNRSVYDTETGDSVDDPRQQINQITAYIDGSVVYGSDQERADALRTFEGGQLATSDGDLLPFNEEGFDNAGGPFDSLFLAGDVRANENAALTAMHTLWVREHNQIADKLATADPTLTDEDIYQQAKAIVVAEIQAITFNEFLPALLSVNAISDYSGYDPTVNAGISNVFSTAAYRFGHSMLSSTLLRLNPDGTTADEGELALRDAFFAPDEIAANGIDSLLQGAAGQNAQEVDNQIIDDVRNFLFGEPGSDGFDLASLNIQRGRDHGLTDYNQTRVDMGLAPVTSFADITSDPDVQASLESLYSDVNNIDVWVGGLAEDHLPGSSMGGLFSTIIADQFERLRDGDQFWYQNVFAGEQLGQIENTSLRDVIERNTEVSGLQDNVFYDASVLYYSDDVDRESGNLVVRLNDGAIDLVDRATRETVGSQAVDDVSKIILAGSNARDDRFAVDVTGGDITPVGGILVDGGAGSNDVLVVRGADTIVVTKENVTVNGTSIDYSGIEVLHIQSGGGHVNLDVADGVGLRVVIDDGNGNHHHKQDRNNRAPDGQTPVAELLVESQTQPVSDASGDLETRRNADPTPDTRDTRLDQLRGITVDDERRALDAAFASVRFGSRR